MTSYCRLSIRDPKILRRQFAYANHSNFSDTKNGASPDLQAELL